MKNGRDYWCFSVIGKPLSKKRVRFAGRFSRFTDNEWYERMIADAFHRAFPDMKPIGHEFYNISERHKKNGDVIPVYKLKKEYSRRDVPTVRLYMFFYFSNGQIGDSDNYVKIVQDALNRVAYVDDFQVCVPTPYIIVNSDEIERVDILITMYDQSKDNHLLRLQDFLASHAKSIDIYDEYEVDRLRELSVKDLIWKLCPETCPKWDECNPRRKDDIIFCENRLK